MATPTETTGGATSVFGTGSENPFGIEHVWEAGDFVTRGLLIVLVIMSAVSWWIMITKAWDQRRLRKQAIQAERDFWTAGSVKQAVDKLKGKNNAFKAIAEEGVRANQHHEGRLTDQIDLHE